MLGYFTLHFFDVRSHCVGISSQVVKFDKHSTKECDVVRVLVANHAFEDVIRITFGHFVENLTARKLFRYSNEQLQNLSWLWFTIPIQVHHEYFGLGLYT